MSVKWHFHDAVTSTDYPFEVNPIDFTLPKQRNVTTQSTVAPNGKTLISAGANQVQEIVCTGTLVTQTQLDMLYTVAELNHQVELHDDLGRTFEVFVTQFTPKRVRSAFNPYKHSYDIHMLIVSWP